MISSTSNGKVKEAAALARKARYRKETGLFVVEGPKMAAEIPPDQMESVFMTERFVREQRERGAEGAAVLEKLEAAPVRELVTEEVLRAMSDTQTPQGVLALARQRQWRLEEILEAAGAAHLLVLETLQDPGNLGTILRTGEGAGITGVIMNRETADIYSPKVARSTMGAIFRVPFVYTDDLPHTLKRLKQAGVRLYAAHLKGTRCYDEESYLADTGFLIGNEARGLTEETASMADAYVRIPMEGQVESLNAAVAASILMYEVSRQRRKTTVRKM